MVLRAERRKAVQPRTRTKNLPSLYSCRHDEFSNRCCPIAEKEVSALRLVIGLQDQANMLRFEKYVLEECFLVHAV